MILEAVCVCVCVCSNSLCKPMCARGPFDFILCQNGEIMVADVDYLAFFVMGSVA